MSKGIYINDSIHGLIGLSELEKIIISSVGFNRLHDVYQNSTVYLTYPSNRTKRFEHSIGTMKLCSDMFFHSIVNASEESINSFYSFYKKKIEEEVIASINPTECDFLNKTPKRIPKVKMDSFRMSLTPRIVPNGMEDVHILLMEAVRVAALLHDIGHPPFSHVVERAMESVYRDSSNKEGLLWKHYNSKISKFFKKGSDGKKRYLHEVMGDDIAKSILKEAALNMQPEDEKVFCVLVLHCVQKMYDEGGSVAFNALHRLIDGGIDGDRLDYVTRDTINSGINNGFIDYSRIILDMQMFMNDGIPAFYFPVKAVNAIEDFLKRRYDLYKKIIFHHRVIKTDYLLEHSVRNLIYQYLDNGGIEKMERSDSIPFDISGLWYPLDEATLKEKGDELSQWNDSWLMTVLKKIYFCGAGAENGDDEGDEEDEHPNLVMKQLAELLRHKKSYYSIIKRGEDFRMIDDAVCNTIKSRAEQLKNLAEQLEKTSDTAKKQIEAEEQSAMTTVVKMDGTLDAVKELIKIVDNNSEGFAVSYVWRKKGHFLNGGVESDAFKLKIEEIVAKYCEDMLESLDTITVFKEISTGTDDPILFYDTNGKKYALDDISGVRMSLLKENDFRPAFYIYTYSERKGENIAKKKSKLLEKIGEEIGEYVVEEISRFFVDLNNNTKEQMKA